MSQTFSNLADNQNPPVVQLVSANQSLILSTSFVHARLVGASDSSLCFEFLINPSELSFSKENHWVTSIKKGFDVPQSEFQGGKPTQLELTLVLDTSEVTDGRRDINSLIAPLIKMSEADPATRDGQSGMSSPPPVRLEWGVFGNDAQTFVITHLNRRYTRFDPNARPIRVEITLTLMQFAAANLRAAQNPTSQSMGRQSYYQVKPGQTLDLIAFEVYGDATQWRKIADSNRLENPLELKPGQLLEIQ